MKKRGLTIAVAAALLLSMVPLTLFSATAEAPQTAAALVEGMPCVTLQDFSKFTPVHPTTIWGYPWSGWNENNADQGVLLQNDGAGKGLYVQTESNKKGTAEYDVYITDADKTFVRGEYLAVQLRKNGVTGSFAVCFGLGTSGYSFILPEDAAIPYDADGTLRQAGAATGELSTRGGAVRTYTVGSAETVTVYLPIAQFVRADTKAPMTAADRADVTNIQILFSDLGNKNDASLENAEAISIRQFAVYTEKTASDPTPAGDQLVEGKKQTVLQDFTEALTIADSDEADVWYSPWWTYPPTLHESRGLCFGDTTADNGTFGDDRGQGAVNNIAVRRLATHDFSGADYLAVTFRRNAVTGAFVSVVQMVVSDAAGNRLDMVLAPGTSILYDNGSPTLQETVVPESSMYERTLTFQTGSANVVKAYIPLSGFVGLTEELAQQILWVNFRFVDLGNRTDYPSIANADAVSIREIALYAPNLTFLGAKLRSELQDGAPAALRFGIRATLPGTVKGEDYAADYANSRVTIGAQTYAVAHAGAVVARADRVADAAQLTVEDAAGGYVVDRTAEKLYDVAADGGSVTYYITVVRIPAAHRSTSIVVRPYIAYYTDETRTTVAYLYGEASSLSVLDVTAPAA